MVINKDTIVIDLIEGCPEALEVLAGLGMSCAGCPGANRESLEDAAESHGVNLAEMLTVLNAIGDK